MWQEDNTVCRTCQFHWFSGLFFKHPLLHSMKPLAKTCWTRNVLVYMGTTKVSLTLKNFHHLRGPSQTGYPSSQNSTYLSVPARISMGLAKPKHSLNSTVLDIYSALLVLMSWLRVPSSRRRCPRWSALETQGSSLSQSLRGAGLESLALFPQIKISLLLDLVGSGSVENVMLC